MTGKRQRERGYQLPEVVDNETRICVTFEIPDDHEYKNAVYAQLSLLGKWWYWKRDESLLAGQVAELMRVQILNTLVFGECGGTAMSCEDVENCLETSGTIADIFGGLSLNGRSVVNTGNVIRRNEYNGTNESVNEDTPPIFSDNSQLEINRMCYSIEFFVNEYAERKIQQINVGLFLGYTSVALTALLSSALGGLGFLIGGSAITAEVFAIATLEEAKTALSNAEALQNVICCIEEFLHTKTVSFANYELGLSQNCYTSGSAEAIIASLLETDRSNTDGYLFLVDILGTMQAVDIIDDCDCILPVACLGTTLYYPSPGHLALSPLDSKATLVGLTVIEPNFGYTWLEFRGYSAISDFTFDFGRYVCFKQFSYTWVRFGPHGSLKFYVDDVLQQTEPLTAPEGYAFTATPNLNNTVGRVLRIEASTNGIACLTRDHIITYSE